MHPQGHIDTMKYTDKDYIVIGAITGSFGLYGDVRVKPLVADTEIFKRIKSCFVDGLDGERKVLSPRPHKEGWLIKLSGIGSPEAAIQCKGMKLFIRRESLPKTAADEVYWYAIEGAEVFDENGVYVGKLTDYVETGSHDVFLIKSENGEEYMISNNPLHVKEIDPDKKRIKVERIGLVLQE